MSEIKVNKISPKQTCTQVTLGDSGDDIIVASGVNFKTPSVKDASGNIIISRCGSNITIGSSGAAVALAAGATQSGFGRTGTVNWDTTAKTTTVTAASGVGYFVDTTSASVTVNLPAGSAGDIVAVSDYANTAATNNIVIGPNGADNIQGVNGNYLINTAGGTVTLVYVDSTQGWRPTDAATASSIIEQPLFTAATGGCIAISGDYKIHTFTGPGTFTVTQLGNGPTNPAGGPNTVSYLVVAGGGGNNGGGGGFREGRDIGPSYTASPLVAPTGLTISQTAYPIIVGGGGNATGPNATPGVASKGNNSVFSTIISAGGGRGGPTGTCRDGGSGAGGNNQPTSSGNTPPVSPSQGFPGGPNVNGQSGSGGGGATEAGQPNNGPNNPGGRGGAGATTSISGSPTAYAGGAGGGANVAIGLSGGAGSPCGTGGKGVGAPPTSIPVPAAAPNAAGNGTTNRGGGGGSGGYGCGKGAGGSGVVVIRYKFQ
jgi:hypothetical protein